MLPSEAPPLKILVVYHSRNGHTASLAQCLAQAWRARGAEVRCEAIEPHRVWAKWWLPVPLLPLLPFLPLYLVSPCFRRLWHRLPIQPSQAIRSLQFDDVSGFDHVVLGTPKWLYLSYPVARWLQVVKGLEGKPVSVFATFCGPPLQVFELDMLFVPLREALSRLHARPSHELAVSSDFHPYFVFNEMRTVFRGLSRWVFGRPLYDFTQNGAVGGMAIRRFVEQVIRADGVPCLNTDPDGT